jgi:hypothetical protein
MSEANSIPAPCSAPKGWRVSSGCDVCGGSWMFTITNPSGVKSYASFGTARGSDGRKRARIKAIAYAHKLASEQNAELSGKTP